ncbi:MAG: hypothetical protein AAFY65_06220 [Pseudomonadota bacterium]
MKRFSIFAAALMTATSAAAYTGVSPQIVTNVESTLQEVGLANVDVTTLSDEQVIEIYAVTQGVSDADKNDAIKAALDGEGYGADLTQRRVILVDPDDIDGLMPMGENSVEMSVQNWLNINGFEVDTETLTDAQIAELYFVAFSSDAAQKQNIAQTIIDG